MSWLRPAVSNRDLERAPDLAKATPGQPIARREPNPFAPEQVVQPQGGGVFHGLYENYAGLYAVCE